MDSPFNYGLEYFREAEQTYSRLRFDLYMCNTPADKEAFATKTAHEIQTWRERWLADHKAQGFTALCTAVELMITRDMSEA